MYMYMNNHVHSALQLEKERPHVTCINKHAMKSTEVQTLGAVTLLATTACTDDASIVGLKSTQYWAIV